MSCSVLEKRNVQNLTSDSAERKIGLEALPRRGAARSGGPLAPARSCHVRSRAGGRGLFSSIRACVECGEDVDISPLTHLGGKKRKSVVGEQLFGETVSGERVCVLGMFVEVGAG